MLTNPEVSREMPKDFSSTKILFTFARKKMGNKITVICYGQKEVWTSRKKAIKFYLDAVQCCDGSEKERYANILCNLMNGNDICSDED